MMKRSRHHIVGSEAGQHRPLAYMRRGHTRRAGRRRPGLWLLLTIPLLAVALIFIVRLIG